MRRLAPGENRLIWRRPMMAILLAFVLSAGVTGCGAEAKENSDVTITVASKSTAEEVILGEIYAQAFEAAGYNVKRRDPLPSGLPPFERKGIHLSGYPEHLNIALKDLLKLKADVPGNAMKAYTMTKEGLEKRGLTAFPPTSFSRSKAVGMLRKTAEERNLTTLSDLRSQAQGLAIMAGGFCRFSLDCLVGIERFYGITFGTFIAIEPALRYKVLEDGEADASMLLTTEGRLAGKKSKFVALEDDKHRLPAGNVSWVTTTDLVAEAGPDYEKAIVDAQKGLTLKVMQRLDAEVKLENKSPAEVATKYLKSIDDGLR